MFFEHCLIILSLYSACFCLAGKNNWPRDE